MCMPTKFETQNEPTMARTDIGSRNLNWIGTPASYELKYQSRRNDKQHEGNDTKSHAKGNMFIHVSYTPAGMIHFLQNRCREQIWEVASWAMLNTFTQRKKKRTTTKLQAPCSRRLQTCARSPAKWVGAHSMKRVCSQSTTSTIMLYWFVKQVFAMVSCKVWRVHEHPSKRIGD